MNCSPPGSSIHCPWDPSGKKTGVGCRFLPQGIFPTQGSYPDLLHYRQILYHLNNQGSPEVSLQNPKMLGAVTSQVTLPGLGVREGKSQQSEVSTCPALGT